MESTHLLIVPPTGIMEFLHADSPIDIDATLRARAEGFSMHLSFDRGSAHWLHHDTSPINRRAREAVAMLSSMHMVFTGPVIITGLTTPQFVDVVKMLSLSGSVTEP